jgi:hypothetical protein
MTLPTKFQNCQLINVVVKAKIDALATLLEHFKSYLYIYVA